MMFTLAMIENPHVWKRAQAENDAVVGTGRLPEFDDRPSLPYVDAIMRGVQMGTAFTPRCVLGSEFLSGNIPKYPTGGPRAVTAGDVYKGYYIPKGISYMYIYIIYPQ